MPLFILKSLIAGIIASFACGLGALPLAIKKINLRAHTGIAYSAAGGLMFAASVYNLILPGLTLSTSSVRLYEALPVIAGIILGGMFLWLSDRYFTTERLEKEVWKKYGNKFQLLIFLVMAIHSIPEGVAVGVGFSSEEIYSNNLGQYIALAIAIHNIPEGLAVAVPLRASGASINKCFWAAVLTSIPQPIAAVPAAYLSWLFQPLMPIMMGFAAGAMIFLIILQLVPEALHSTSSLRVAWAFILGFCAMILVQVIL